MILATKSGWLIGVEIVRQTPTAFIVRAWDEKRERRVQKDSEEKKLFDCTKKATIWINTVNTAPIF
jgi:hypothetical protein